MTYFAMFGNFSNSDWNENLTNVIYSFQFEVQMDEIKV